MDFEKITYDDARPVATLTCTQDDLDRLVALVGRANADDAKDLYDTLVAAGGRSVYSARKMDGGYLPTISLVKHS